MKGIAIYVEGGGDTAHQSAELRIGFDQLFRSAKEKARSRKLKWRLICAGGRDATFKAFASAIVRSDGQTLCVLLVDSESELPREVKAPVTESTLEYEDRVRGNALARRSHLSNRDHWQLNDVSPDQIHLMVQCMEAWIVADPEAMAKYYGQGFHANKLPNRHNLEEEPKSQVFVKLKHATKDTQKKQYAKIAHAAKLIALIDPMKVRGRCPRFATFIDWLDRQIDSA